jgi:hypothetical protein
MFQSPNYPLDVTPGYSSQEFIERGGTQMHSHFAAVRLADQGVDGIKRCRNDETSILHQDIHQR